MSKKKTKQDETSLNTDLDEVLSRLTMDQIRFVIARQEAFSDKEAAENLNMKAKAVSNWKQNGAPIDEALRLIAMDGMITALHIRRRVLAKAMAVKAAGLESDNERVRQSVATEIIEWEAGKATQKQELTGKDGGPIETNTNYTDAEFIRTSVALAQALRAIGDTEDIGTPGDVDAAEPPTVASDTEPG